MGCTVREKHGKTNRRAKLVKPTSSDADHSHMNDKNNQCSSKSMLDSGLKPWNFNMGFDENSDTTCFTIKGDPINPGFEDCGWGYCTEEQLEEILLKHLEFLYDDVVSQIVYMGYDEEVALKAVLRNGHCYGGMDVLTNVLNNSLYYLTNGNCGNAGSGAECEIVFTDLKQLEEYTLAGMIFLLQQVHPHLSRGDAMWCLLMSDLHLGRASTIDIPMLPSPSNSSSGGMSNVGTVNAGAASSGSTVDPELCKFHGGCGFGNEGSLKAPDGGVGESLSCSEATPREIDYSEKFNLSPSMKLMLKRNVEAFAAGFRSRQGQAQAQTQAQAQAQSQLCNRITTKGDSSKASSTAPNVVPKEPCQGSRGSIKDDVNSVLNKFRDLNLDENSKFITEDQKDAIVLKLLHQVKDLEKQVSERKDWAHQKAMQAARKLSSDMTELKILRMEREETQRLKTLKQVLEDTTMKRLSEMENALRKASSQVDCANAAVKKLETENAEIRAEMEASKLSASESVKTSLEIAKREKKYLKKLVAWEKQKAKLQDEIATVKQNSSLLQQQLVQINDAQKEVEAKWRQEVKNKEHTMVLVEEERRLKETTEVNNKRKLEALRLRVEMDFARHKDDFQRLEQDLSRLKSSSNFIETNNPSETLPTGSPTKMGKPQGQSIARLLRELDEPESEVNERECIVCMKDEVSVVFLPCAHQVMCAGCSEDYGKKRKATCPCCRVPIEQRIRVFGASSG